MADFDDVAQKLKDAKPDVNKPEMVKVYGLFKQAKMGDCNIEKPGMMDPAGQAKWEAWTAQKGKTSDEAKEEYVEVVKGFLGL